MELRQALLEITPCLFSLVFEATSREPAAAGRIYRRLAKALEGREPPWVRYVGTDGDGTFNRGDRRIEERVYKHRGSGGRRPGKGPRFW